MFPLLGKSYKNHPTLSLILHWAHIGQIEHLMYMAAVSLQAIKHLDFPN